jgi:hypothetical protein
MNIIPLGDARLLYEEPYRVQTCRDLRDTSPTTARAQSNADYTRRLAQIRQDCALVGFMEGALGGGFNQDR